MAEGTSAPGGNPLDKDSIILDGNGNLSVGLNNIIDDSSIKIDGNGDLRASGQITYVIGDWEAGSLDAWNSFGDSNSNDVIDVQGSNGGAESTSDYARLRAYTDTSQYIYRSYDLTNKDSVVVYIKSDPRNQGLLANQVDIKIGGNVEYSDSNPPTSWTKIEIDTESYSGSTTIEIYNENPDLNSYNDLGVDRVKAVQTGIKDAGVVNVDSGAGN